MRVIIAARLSQKGRKQSGLYSQDEDAREYAEDNEHEIIDVIQDHVSGTKAMWDRKNMKPWVTDPEFLAKYDGIIAAKQDRLSRQKFWDEIELRKWAEANHKFLFIVDKNMVWPPKDEDDIQRWNDGAAAARREWKSTSKRYTRMQRSRRRDGALVGRPIYGYAVTCKDSCGLPLNECEHFHTLGIDSVTGPIVKEMAIKYLDGQTLQEVTNWLNESGILTQQNKQWSPKTVAQILRDETIMGIRHQREYDPDDKTKVIEEHILHVPAILSKKEFDSVQSKLDVRASRKGISPHKGTAMLTGIIRCTKCGGNMYRIGDYYRCHRNPETGKPSTCKNMVRMDTAHNWVGWFITEMMDKPYKVRVPGRRTNNDEEIGRLNADIKALDFTKSESIGKAAELSEKIQKLTDAPDTIIQAGWKATGETIGEHWASLDDAGRRQFILDSGAYIRALRDGTKTELRLVDFPE